jgi:maltooligosyltrehalose synthase
VSVALCIFKGARIWADQGAVVIAPMFFVALAGQAEDPLGQRVWGTVAVDLPARVPGCWREIFTGRRLETDGKIPADEALKHFPVSLLLN